MRRYRILLLADTFLNSPRSDVEIALLLPAYGAIIGSMVGVIPEGLDWEEPWQVRLMHLHPSPHRLAESTLTVRNGQFRACCRRS